MDTLNDIFSGDAYSLVSLTTAIQKIPHMPSLVGDLGLFSDVPITTLDAVFEEENQALCLLDTSPRGTPADLARHEKRTVRSVRVPQIQLSDSVMAHEVMNIREFGTGSRAQTVAGQIAKRLKAMSQCYDVTREWAQLGALKGLVVNPNSGSTILDIFDFFDITPPADVDFDLGTDTAKIGEKCVSIARTIEAALGNMPYTGIIGLVGADFWDAFVEHPEVKYAFQFFENAGFLRDDLRRTGFTYKGIKFLEYRGKIGSKSFIDETSEPEARFFPIGVPELFQQIYAPADFEETVNTMGQSLYAKQEPMKYGRGREIYTQSNPLSVCTRPGVLVRGTTST